MLILQKKAFIEEEEHSGFRAGRSCTDNVFSLKQIIEKKTATNRDIHITFIDLQKAYDTVPVTKLWEVLQESNINYTLIKALKNLYHGSTSRIKISNFLTSEFPVSKGLRQGCCISPTLFKIYISKALSTWKRKCHGMGIELNDTCLYTLQFADDQAVIANDKDDMEYMVKKLVEEYDKWGLTVNVEKTKYMCIGADAENLTLDDGRQISTCKEYKYLGVMYNTEGTDEQEINIRVTQARKAIKCLNGILWNKNISKKRKFNIYEAIIKSILTYGAETWRLTEKNKRKIEAVEMDAIRRSMRISRKERVRNDEIRRRMGVEGTVVQDIERQQLRWYGHVQRMPEERIPKQTLIWIPAEKRRRGRPKKSWIEGIKKAMSERNLAEGQWDNRQEWKSGIGQRRKTF